MPPIDYAKSGEEQTLQVTVIFRVKHNPGNENHLRQLLKHELIYRGLTVREDGTIVV